MAGPRDSDAANTATLPAASGSDPAQTATVPARGGGEPVREHAARDDIESAMHDHAELPVIDPDTYVFGHYFARGGMGRIAAVRDKRLGRVIAIKELIVKNPDLVARFHREIRITARLQHPSIVSVLEAGQWASGEPFFAMKKVSGESLKEAIDRRKTLDDRLGLLASTIAIVDALAYAHDHGIIHRDLKPANVLVGEFGETVVIDWGLAKDLRATDDAEDPLPTLGSGDAQMTVAGSILGTPAFMAPEQARGEDADERTDVYALGAILYNVLIGKPPYEGSDPTSIMQRVLAGPPRAIGEIEPGVPVDLQTIVARAMAREPAERYRSAKELAADLKRFQTGQLVAAHRYTRGQLVRRWLRRHRGAVFVGIVALVALAALGTASFVRIVGERDRARAAEQQASARADALVLEQAKATVAGDPLAALQALAQLSLSSAHWPAARLVAADAVARGLPRHIWNGHGIEELDISPDGKRLAFSRGAKLELVDLATGTTRTLGSHDAEISDINFSHDGTRVVTASRDNSVGIWTLDGAPPLARRLRGHAGYVIGVEFTPGDTHVVSSGLDRTTRVWTLATDEVHSVPALLGDRKLSADRRWLFAHEPGVGNAIWDVTTGKRALELGDRCATFVPGTATAVIAGGGKIVVRDMARGTETKLGDLSDRCTDIVVGAGDRLVIGTSIGAVLVGYTHAKGSSWVYRGLTKPVSELALRDDGAWIAAWSDEGEVHLIDTRTRTGQALAGSRGEARFVGADEVFAFDANQNLLAWTTLGGGARVFAGNPASRVAVSPDGKTLASGGPGWMLRLTDLETRTTRDLAGHHGPVHDVAFSPNGALVASLGDDHRVHLWERASGRGVQLPGRAHTELAFSADGHYIAAIGDREDISVWTVATGALRTLGGHKGSVFALAFSRRANLLASGGGDGTVRTWNAQTGESRTLGSHGAPVRDIAFSPDGTRIAAVDEAGGVRVWPIAGGAARSLPGHTGWVLAVAFDPSGRHLATAGTDRTVRLWDLASGMPAVLGSHTSTVLGLAFSPDGATLASTSLDGSARLWDLATREYRVLAGHASWVLGVTWFADSRHVATASHDGTVRVWSDELPREPKALRDWLARVAR